MATVKALLGGRSTTPPEEVAVRKLVLAGVAAYGFGGNSAAPASGDHRPRASPASLHGREIVARFSAFLHGEAELSRQDFHELQLLVMAGLEAYGFASAPDRRSGRPARPGSAEQVRFIMARRYRDVAAGRLKLAGVLDECARDKVIGLRDGCVGTLGRDQSRQAIMPFEEASVADARRRMEVAHHRLPRMSQQEIRNRRSFMACSIRLFRSVGAITD